MTERRSATSSQGVLFDGAMYDPMKRTLRTLAEMLALDDEPYETFDRRRRTFRRTDLVRDTRGYL